MLVLFAALFFSLGAAAPCTILSDPVENDSAAAAFLTCGVSSTVCDNGTGVCRVISVASLFIWDNATLASVSFPALSTITGSL
jgi:hypothetical protein